MEKFGIFAPALGKRTNWPVQLLDDAVTPLSHNVRTVDGEVHRAKGRVEVCTTPAWDTDETYAAGNAVTHGGTTYTNDTGSNSEPPSADWTAVASVPDSTSPILHYHRLVLRSGAAYLFCFTKDGIFEWDETNSYWVDRVGEHDGGLPLAITIAPCTGWSTATYHDATNDRDVLVASNNTQSILVGANGTDFTYLGDNTSADQHGPILDGGAAGIKVHAKFVVVHENYLHLCNTNENSADKPNRDRHNGIGDIDDWNDAGAAAGYNDIPGRGGLNGGKVDGHRLWLWQDNQYGFTHLTDNPDVRFPYTEVSDKYGCKAPGSIISRADGTVLFLASDMRLRVAGTGQDISDPIDDVLAKIPVGAVSAVRAHRVEEYDEVWWAIPYGGGQTANNRVLTLTAGGAWNELAVAIPCFGIYSTQVTYTIGTVPYVTLAEWQDHWPTIGDPQGASGFLYDIAAGTAGDTYRLHAATTDAGSDFTGEFSLATDLSPQITLHMYKVLLRIRLYVMRDFGTTMDVAIARDRELIWQHIKSVTIPTFSDDDSGDMVILDYPCRRRARHFDIRIGSNDGNFRCVGAEFEYIQDGAR